MVPARRRRGGLPVRSWSRPGGTNRHNGGAENTVDAGRSVARDGSAMRSLFSSAPADPNPVPVAEVAGGGWNGLSGRTKMGILGGGAIAAITAVMWPGFHLHPPPTETRPPQQHPPPAVLGPALNPHPPKTQPGPANQHPPARISDYDSPPPVQDVVARVMNDRPATRVVRGRPVPTEMALYTGPKATAASTVSQVP